MKTTFLNSTKYNIIYLCKLEKEFYFLLGHLFYYFNQSFDSKMSHTGFFKSVNMMQAAAEALKKVGKLNISHFLLYFSISDS